MKALLLSSLALALSANAFAQKLAPALIETMSGERIGYKNSTGQVVIKPRFEAGKEFVNGYAAVQLAGKWGMIDSTGREVLPCKYRELDYFSEGLAGASLDGKKWGFINPSGVVVIPFSFDGVGEFNEGRTTANLGRKCALINKKGTLLTPYKYQGIEAMKGGIARVLLKNDSREDIFHAHYWGFINAQGHEISKLDNYGYESPNLENGYAVARQAKPEVLPASLNARQRALHATLVGQTYTYSSTLIDKTGRVVIPASMGYEFGNWGEDYIIVKKGEAYGVVSMTGKVLLPVGFYEITDFKFGADGTTLAKAFTTDNGKFFYVDRQFKCVEFGGVKCPEY